MNKIFEIEGEPCGMTKTCKGSLSYRSLVFIDKTPTQAAERLLKAINYLLEQSNDSIVYWRVKPNVKRSDKDYLAFCAGDDGKTLNLDNPQYTARCRLLIYPEIDEKHWEFVQYHKECESLQC